MVVSTGSIGHAKHRKSGKVAKALTGKTTKNKGVRRKGLTHKEREAKRGTHKNKYKEP